MLHQGCFRGRRTRRCGLLQQLRLTRQPLLLLRGALSCGDGLSQRVCILLGLPPKNVSELLQQLQRLLLLLSSIAQLRIVQQPIVQPAAQGYENVRQVGLGGVKIGQASMLSPGANQARPAVDLGDTCSPGQVDAPCSTAHRLAGTQKAPTLISSSCSGGPSSSPNRRATCRGRVQTMTATLQRGPGAPTHAGRQRRKERCCSKKEQACPSRQRQQIRAHLGAQARHAVGAVAPPACEAAQWEAAGGRLRASIYVRGEVSSHRSKDAWSLFGQPMLYKHRKGPSRGSSTLAACTHYTS